MNVIYIFTTVTMKHSAQMISTASTVLAMLGTVEMEHSVKVSK